MKTTDLKVKNKSARKSAANDIEVSLNAALKKVAAKLGQDSKRFTKEIEKGSKRLAKKLSKEMEFAEQVIQEAGTAAKPGNGAVEKPKVSAKSEEKPGTTANAAPATKTSPAKTKTSAKPVAKDSKPV